MLNTISKSQGKTGDSPSFESSNSMIFSKATWKKVIATLMKPKADCGYAKSWGVADQSGLQHTYSYCHMKLNQAVNLFLHLEIQSCISALQQTDYKFQTKIPHATNFSRKISSGNIVRWPVSVQWLLLPRKIKVCGYVDHSLFGSAVLNLSTIQRQDDTPAYTAYKQGYPWMTH